MLVLDSGGGSWFHLSVVLLEDVHALGNTTVLLTRVQHASADAFRHALPFHHGRVQEVLGSTSSLPSSG